MKNVYVMFFSYENGFPLFPDAVRKPVHRQELVVTRPGPLELESDA